MCDGPYHIIAWSGLHPHDSWCVSGWSDPWPEGAGRVIWLVNWWPDSWCVMAIARVPCSTAGVTQILESSGNAHHLQAHSYQQHLLTFGTHTSITAHYKCLSSVKYILWVSLQLSSYNMLFSISQVIFFSSSFIKKKKTNQLGSTLSLNRHTEYAISNHYLSSDLPAIINSPRMDLSSVSCLLYVHFMSF
jgi:hypothetical protein